MHIYLQKAKHALEKNNLQTAKSWLYLLISISLPSITENDKNIAYHALSYIAFTLKNYQQGRNYFNSININEIETNSLIVSTPQEVVQKLQPLFPEQLPTIPTELIISIITYIADYKTLGKLAQVNWAWLNISNDKILWKIALDRILQQTNPSNSFKYLPQKIIEIKKQILQLVENANIHYKLITQNIKKLSFLIFDLPNELDYQRVYDMENYTKTNNCLGIMLMLNPHINRKIPLNSQENQPPQINSQLYKQPLIIEYDYKVANASAKLAKLGFTESLSALLFQFRDKKRIIDLGLQKNSLDESNCLLHAFQNNQDECIAIILQNNPAEHDIAEAYIYAIENNKEPYIEWIAVNSTFVHNYTFAIQTKNLRLMLVQINKNVSFLDINQKQQALNLITFFDDETCLKALLIKHRDLTILINAFKAAIENNAHECLTYLLKIDLLLPDQYSLIEHAFQTGAHKTTILSLIKTFNIPNIRIYVLIESAKYGRTDLIEQLMIPGDDKNLKIKVFSYINLYYHNKLIYLLHYALQDIEFLKLLLSAQTIKILSTVEDPLDMRNVSNIIPQLAVYYRLKDILIMLLDAGIGINLTPIGISRPQPPKPGLSSLPSYLSSINENTKNPIQSSTGTPLMIAVWLGSLSYTQLLLKYGANIQLQFPANSFIAFDCEKCLSDKKYGGYTAIHFATEKPEILRELISARQFSQEILSLKTDDGHTAVHVAVINRNAACLNILLTAKANPNTTDKKGHSPLSFALIYGRTDIIMLLLDHGAQLSDVDNKLIEQQLYQTGKDKVDLLILYIKLLFSSKYFGSKNHKTYLPVLLHFIEANNITCINEMIVYMPNYITIVTNQVKLAFNWLRDQIIKPANMEDYKKAVELALNKCHWICAKHLLEVRIDSQLQTKGQNLPLKEYLKELLYAKGLWSLVPIVNLKYDTSESNQITSYTNNTPRLTLSKT